MFFKKIRNNIYILIKRKLVFFIATKSSYRDHCSEKTNFDICYSYLDFIELKKKYCFPNFSDANSRFSKGNILFYLYNENSYISYGWATRQTSPFFIDYFQMNIIMVNKTMILFDFYTNEKYRQKGYYNKILKHILDHEKEFNLIIYTAPSNYASIKGIESVGFERIGVYTKLKLILNLIFGRSLKKIMNLP